MYGSVSISSFGKDDERILASSEFTFVFLRGETTSQAFLCSYNEVFGRNQIRLKLLKFLPTDLLGQLCSHCKEQISTPDDLALGIHKSAVTTVLHETCFSQWFLQQTKQDITPYRFVITKNSSVSCSPPFTTFVTGSIELPSPITLTLLSNLDFKKISAPTNRSLSAEVTNALSNTDKPGLNIFFCPRCNATVEISFLDTEDRIHTCEKCGGRFQIQVKEVL
jgi:DNA-directed RNA polymerase subunit RPC12/RpoP